MSPSSVASPMNEPGRVEFSRVVAPAHQRLEAHHLVGMQVDLGLEGAAELAVADRQPQPLFELHVRGHSLADAGVEEDRLAFVPALGAVHGVVRVTAQDFVAGAVLRIDADADRRRGEHLERLDVERLLQRVEQRVDDAPGLLFVCQGLDQQHEFVAADARQHVGVAQRLADALRHLHQQGVADDVAVVVVDVLEIIEIDKGQREAMAAVAAQRLVDAFVDEKAVGQAGEVVEEGVLRQFLLDLLARADVERGRNQQRPAGDRRRRVRRQPGAFARRARGVFLDGDRCTGADEVDFPLPPLRGLFRRQKIGRGSANQGLRRGFQVGGGRLVDQDEATAFVLHGQADRKRVDDVLEERAILLRVAGVALPILDLPAPSRGLGRERVAVTRRDRCQGHDRALAGEGDVAFIELGFAGFAPQQQQGAAPAYADRQAKRRRTGRDQVRGEGLSSIAAARAAHGTDRAV